MGSRDEKLLRRLAFGCVGLIFAIILLIIVAIRLGYIKVIQDMSAGDGSDDAAMSQDKDR